MFRKMVTKLKYLLVSMQGLAGASMPQVKGLEIDMLESGEGE